MSPRHLASVCLVAFGGCWGTLSGAGPADAGGAAADSGSTSLDSGTPPPDSGAAPLDAGPPRDAGVRRPDAGIVSASCLNPAPAFTAEELKLVNQPADSWSEAPNTPLADACPKGFSCNVILPWSGGAYDPVHHQMLIFGGGHGDYSGNELYAFSLSTMTWSRLTEPSSPDLKNQDPLPDGTPVSRHTYDGLQYLTHKNRFWAHGGSTYQLGNASNVPWTFDVETRTWEEHKPNPQIPISFGFSHGSAYDPVTKKVYVHRTAQLATYDVDLERWDTLIGFGTPPYWPRYENYGNKRGVIDSKRRLLWVLGGGSYLVWNIDAATMVTDDWTSTGGTTADNAADIGGHTEQLFSSGGAEIWKETAPGVDYDPTADALVGWAGGGPWVLDLTTREWSHVSGAGAPAAQSEHGTYGRWRYVPRLNIFVLVNATDANVAFYKHTAGCGT